MSQDRSCQVQCFYFIWGQISAPKREAGLLLWSPWKLGWETTPVGGQPVCLIFPFALRAAWAGSTFAPCSPCLSLHLTQATHFSTWLSPTPPWRLSKHPLHPQCSDCAPIIIRLPPGTAWILWAGSDSSLFPLDWNSLRVMTAFSHLCFQCLSHSEVKKC